ncbi:MAG: prepilin-type N-terminal cleavage/methylation domain-containing protein [Erysipelotrichia bacterium]|nr:prepilin-type N-terminal cleavage/methylation domain-containing protein [Erysipelotrichia bacterium]
MNIQTRPDDRRAVTLVEIMISILILGIVLSIGYVFINRTFMSLERQRQSLDTLHEARNFLMVIERDLREMTEVVELDTIFKSSLFEEENALLYKLTILVPRRGSDKIFEKVTYSYEGPEKHLDSDKAQKIIYRQVEGGVKKPLITKQMNYLKIWGTDGTIFRNRHPDESLVAYRDYLAPHYYHPSNPAAKGLKTLSGIKGIEVQLSMHEMYDSERKPIKQRTFITRIYSRILNAKYE